MAQPIRGTTVPVRIATQNRGGRPTFGPRGIISLAGDVLFVSVKRHRLVVIDQKEGSELVENLSPNNPPETEPTIVDGRLFYGTTNGRLVARNAASGDVAWHVELPQIPDDHGGEQPRPLSSTPAIADEQVYVRGVNPDDWKDRATFCFHTQGPDGGTRCSGWPLAFDMGTFADPVVHGELLVAQTRGTVQAIDRPTGTRRWQHELPVPDAFSSTPVTPAIGPDRIYVQTHAGLQARRRDDGSVVWMHQVEAVSGSLADRMYSVYPPAVADGVVYTGFIDGGFEALDTDTGETLWRFEPEQDTVFWTSPALDGDRVYVGAEGPQGSMEHPQDIAWDDSRLYALDRTTGESLLISEQDGYLTDPVVGGGGVYVSFGNGVTCFR